jgi:hypothetical protein
MIFTTSTRYLRKKTCTVPQGVSFEIMKDFLFNPFQTMEDLARKYNVSVYKAQYQTGKMLVMTSKQREEFFGYKEKN